MASKREWLARVASATASHLGASQSGEILNMGDDEYEALSDADQARLAWAEDEVQNRLYRMGRRDR